MKMINLKSDEGYPLTVKQFYALEENCERIWIKDNEIEAFKKACYRSLVRYIPVIDCLKEDKPEGATFFFTRHRLNSSLFILGKCFQEELAKSQIKKKS